VADDRLRAAGTEGLYVAGDIAEYDSVVHGRRVRIEHEEVAAAHGRTVARNMLGDDAPHAEVPYFFSDLADWAWLEYVGPAHGWDDEALDGEPASGKFAITYRRDGQVVAYLSANGHGDLDAAKAQIAAAG
jgi:3-phenylpropionate/trans-cinnamate dioxygenase ferredoxin reductase subunit